MVIEKKKNEKEKKRKKDILSNIANYFKQELILFDT